MSLSDGQTRRLFSTRVVFSSICRDGFLFVLSPRPTLEFLLTQGGKKKQKNKLKFKLNYRRQTWACLVGRLVTSTRQATFQTERVENLLESLSCVWKRRFCIWEATWTWKNTFLLRRVILWRRSNIRVSAECWKTTETSIKKQKTKLLKKKLLGGWLKFKIYINI